MKAGLGWKNKCLENIWNHCGKPTLLMYLSLKSKIGQMTVDTSCITVLCYLSCLCFLVCISCLSCAFVFPAASFWIGVYTMDVFLDNMVKRNDPLKSPSIVQVWYLQQLVVQNSQQLSWLFFTTGSHSISIYINSVLLNVDRSLWKD